MSGSLSQELSSAAARRDEAHRMTGPTARITGKQTSLSGDGAAGSATQASRIACSASGSIASGEPIITIRVVGLSARHGPTALRRPSREEGVKTLDSNRSATQPKLVVLGRLFKRMGAGRKSRGRTIGPGRSPLLVRLRAHHEIQFTSRCYFGMRNPGSVQRLAVEGGGLDIDIFWGELF